jgi:bifunctional DNA-binding transcriptional regulator/antitoxin component of YhaV-PrlF toxin-antitoxin module
MKKIYYVKLSPQGQITIPAEAIRKLGWLKGKTKLALGRVGRALVIDRAEGEEVTSL